MPRDRPPSAARSRRGSRLRPRVAARRSEWLSASDRAGMAPVGSGCRVTQRRPLSSRGRPRQATRNLGAASQSAATSRPARSTVKSGRTSAAAALPSASHWYRGEPGSTSSTSVPRLRQQRPLLGRERYAGHEHEPAAGHVVVPDVIRQERVRAQPSVEGPAGSASFHQCGPAQRWCLAVEEAVAQAGDPVQPRGDGPAEQVTGPAALGHGRHR